MKKLNKLFIAFGIILMSLLASTSSKAQTPPNHIYHMNTWYMADGVDSAGRADRNAMLQEIFTKVTMKNEFVLHQWTMPHFFTEDSREFVTITEYASLADMEKAFDRDDALTNQAWPDIKVRDAFMKKLNGYFTHHKDAIYGSLPKMVK